MGINSRGSLVMVGYRLAGVLVAILTAGCGPARGEPDVSFEEREPGPPVCEGGLASPVVMVQRKLAVTGSTPNAVRAFGDEAFVVESGSNTISVADLEAGGYDVRVDVGNEHNPWEVWADDEEIWITNYWTNTVTVADRRSGEVVREIEHESFATPQGIGGTAEYVYVGNAHYDGLNEYGQGTVSVIERATHEVVAVHTLAAKNPLYIEAVDFSFGQRVVVVASGAHLFDDSGAAVVGSPAAVELWEESGDPRAPERVVVELGESDDARVGLPGRPLPLGDVLYFASATAPMLFKLDAATGEFLRGADDPIAFADTPGDSLNHATIDERGAIYVSSFNEDALYVVDTTCDATLTGPIELDPGSMLAGAHDVAAVSEPTGLSHVYFLLTHANELGRVRFRYD